ncbi:hypothetical protein P4S72_22010 [Vibrio sp. PP-XX7]
MSSLYTVTQPLSTYPDQALLFHYQRQVASVGILSSRMPNYGLSAFSADDAHLAEIFSKVENESAG